MSEWRKYKIDDVAEIVGGGTPSTKIEKYWNGEIPWLTPRDLSNSTGRFIARGERNISKLGLLNSSARLIPKGSVLLSSRAPVGYIAITKNEITTNQGFRSLIPKGNTTTEFLYYLLTNNIEYLKSQATGTTFGELAGSTLKSLSFDFPPLTEQKAIAGLLSSLDDKIDLLHRQNKTLEAMAEALFRQWFVEEADEGWEEGTIVDICLTITKGTTPTTLGHQFTERGVNFVKVESITDTGDFIWEKFAQISPETHTFLSRSIIKSGDVLCSIAGTIGRVAITTDEILPANTNQAIAIIRVNPEKSLTEFIYLFLKSLKFREIMDGKIVHAVQPNLSLGEIGNTELKIPPVELLNKFKQLIEPIFKKKHSNTKQIRTLEKLRDTLLPKLLSGEVRVAV